jgi:hypothetical protein
MFEFVINLKAAKTDRSDTLAGISLAGESSDQVMEENKSDRTTYSVL